ncbi:MAG: hypothetical protein LBS53_01835 [Synergistaceae bacterium]|jgi:hypothetical protein|nr:hypothetical protein [Synergistaceae bacterium]
MFNRIEISIGRAFFWPTANLIYWGLIFLAWWDTRFKVFLGISMVEKFGELRDFSAVMKNISELEGWAHTAIAKSGAMPSEFIMIPLVTAVVLFIVPFVVRRDYGAPVRGAIILPAMTLLCYFFTSILIMIVVAAMSAGIHYLMFRIPGPDIFMFMIHPLYLIYPFFDSLPGFTSQCVYLIYTASVLCTESIDEDEKFDDRDDEFDAPSDDDDWDKSACLMEMDRLTRILNTKFDTPAFIERVRADVSEYINSPAQIRNEMKLGLPHYKIILTETKNSLFAILDADPKTPKASDAFAFVIDEMVRMEYISAEDANIMKTFKTRGPIQERETEQNPLNNPGFNGGNEK